MYRISKEKDYVTDTVKKRIQEEASTAMDDVVVLRIKIAFRLINASTGQDAESAAAVSKREEQVGMTMFFTRIQEKQLVPSIQFK